MTDLPPTSRERDLLAVSAAVVAAERVALVTELALLGRAEHLRRCKERRLLASCEAAADGWAHLTVWHGAIFSTRDAAALGELDDLLGGVCAGRSWSRRRGVEYTAVSVSGPDAQRLVDQIATFATGRLPRWRVEHRLP